MTRRAARLPALLAGLVVALALAELLVRLFGLAPEVAFLEASRYRLSDDPRIGYEPLPTDSTNSLGFRDREHETAAAPGVYRIAVLGDSIAAGLRIERDEEVFPAVLERILNQRGMRAEVINFGVNGYNTMQEVALFERKGLRFRPDLVLVAYCLNDTERSDGLLLEGLIAAEEQAPSGWSRPLSTSALYRALRFGLSAPDAPREAELREKYAVLYENTVLRSLEELAGLGRAHGFDLLVAVFPYFRDIGQYDDRYAVLHAYLEEHSAVIGARHLDLLETFRDCRARHAEAVALDTLHPSARGHRCAAEAMASVILAE